MNNSSKIDLLPQHTSRLQSQANLSALCAVRSSKRNSNQLYLAPKTSLDGTKKLSAKQKQLATADNLREMKHNSLFTHADKTVTS